MLLDPRLLGDKAFDNAPIKNVKNMWINSKLTKEFQAMYKSCIIYTAHGGMDLPRFLTVTIGQWMC